MHFPRFSSGPHGSYTSVDKLWQHLRADGAEIALAGHDHLYERFARLDRAPAARPPRHQVVRGGHRGRRSVRGRHGAARQRGAHRRPLRRARAHAVRRFLRLAIRASSAEDRRSTRAPRPATDDATEALLVPLSWSLRTGVNHGKRRGRGHVEAEVRADQAPREHRHDGPHRPRQDDLDRGDHQAPGREGHGPVHPVRRDRQGARGARARHHDRDRPRRVRDRQPPLRPRRHARTRRLREEHDHRRRPGRRRDPGRQCRRRPDAPDPRARAAGPPGGRALHRRGPQQVRHGRRPRAVGARRARGPRAAQWLRVPRRRRPGDPGLGAEGPRGRRGMAGEDRRADGRGRHLHRRAHPRHRQALPDADRGRLLDHRPRHGRHRAASSRASSAR